MAKKKKSSGTHSVDGALSEQALEAVLTGWARRDAPLPALGCRHISDAVFLQDAEEIMFPSTLSPSDRRLVHKIAGKAGLFHVSIEDQGAKRICVSRTPKEVEDSSAGAPKPRTPHAALCLTQEERAALQTRVSAPHCPADRSYVQFVEYALRAAKHENDLSRCSADVSSRPCVWVDTVGGLYAAAAHIRTCREFAFDLEMHSQRSYHGITCLIQIAVSSAKDIGGRPVFPSESTDYVIDCLAVWEHIGPAMGELFADPSITKIGHALRMDTAALFRDFAIIQRSVFDTQVAWSVLKDALGNTGMVGLAPLLLHYGAPDGSGEDMVKIKHDLSQFDWRTRPLPPHTLHYAQMDVHLLIPAAYLMLKALVKKDIDEDAANREAAEQTGHRHFGYVDMVFYQSQSNAALLWSPRKPALRAAAWASRHYLSAAEEHDDVDGQGDKDVVEPQPAHEDLTDVAGAGDSDEHIHVHVAGSRAKLGHDLKTRRRATRKQVGLHGSIVWRTDINLLVAQRLLEWRDRIGRLLDESPAYVCSSVILLKIAEQKPHDLAELYQVWSPLPPIVLRIQKECPAHSTDVSGDFIPKCDCITSAVRAAVMEYHSIVNNFINSEVEKKKRKHNVIATTSAFTDSASTEGAEAVSSVRKARIGGILCAASMTAILFLVSSSTLLRNRRWR